MVGGLQSAHRCSKAGIFRRKESSAEAKAKQHPWRAPKLLLQGERGAEIATRGYGRATGCTQAQGLSPPRFIAYGGDGVVTPRAEPPAPLPSSQAGLRARAMQSPGHQHKRRTARVTASWLLAFLIQLVFMLNMF